MTYLKYLADEMGKFPYLTVQRKATVNLLVSEIQIFRKEKSFLLHFIIISQYFWIMAVCLLIPGIDFF